jgi:hypothetical protein
MSRLNWIHIDASILDSTILDRMVSELGSWAPSAWIALMVLWTTGGEEHRRKLNGKIVRGIYKRHSLRAVKGRLGVLKLGYTRTVKLLIWLDRYQNAEGEQHLILDDDSREVLKEISNNWPDESPTTLRQTVGQLSDKCSTTARQIGIFWPKLLHHNRRFYDSLAKHSINSRKPGNSGSEGETEKGEPLLSKMVYNPERRIWTPTQPGKTGEQ